MTVLSVVVVKARVTMVMRKRMATMEIVTMTMEIVAMCDGETDVVLCNRVQHIEQSGFSENPGEYIGELGHWTVFLGTILSLLAVLNGCSRLTILESTQADGRIALSECGLEPPRVSKMTLEL